MEKTPKLKTHRDVYEPAEDSYLLAENIDAKPGETVLDVGTGSGIQAIVAAKTAKSVLAVDINPKAVKLATSNAELNGVKNVEFRVSDLFENAGGRFDLIIFNPPYVPSYETDLLGKAWAGGKDGREVIDRFLCEAGEHLTDEGRFLLLVSSLNKIDELGHEFKKHGFGFEAVAEKKLFFERPYVVKGRRFI
ncbi:MAG: protoporphyrinogen oxidase [Candidatus Altiarchaeales archaeon IMC4]|nr:MAG: protoporphyrinogen oxidase [Candidatus Altiarchaeales archaeon IMC4]